jgi:DHA1 family tetracycline resistance protein-like MFS transporter
VLGFSLLLPLLPFYAAAFDATPTVVGLLLGANALTQLVGAPILGRLSDRYGRRPLLILSITGTVAGFLLLGWADSLWWLPVLLAPMALPGGVLGVAANNMLTKSVFPEVVGGTLGIAASWGSLVRVVSPVAGPFLLEKVIPAAPGLLGVLLMIWLIPFVWKRILLEPAPACLVRVWGERGG